MSWLYLDNNATTQPLPEVVEAVDQVHRELWANPSSVHRFGQMVRQRVELARVSVARLLAAREREVVFTSGGTEANNLALGGALNAGRRGGTPSGGTAGGRVLVTTKIEHSAIRQPAEALGATGVALVHVPVDRAGLVNPADLDAALAKLRQEGSAEGASVLVSVQWANNETGVIQPIAELAAVVAKHRALMGSATRLLFHADATQAVGKIPVDVRAVPVDLLTMSAHKFHGPKGVGALYIRSGVKLSPLMLGGPQERDRRGGTENTSGIIGMGVAAEAARAWMEAGDGAPKPTAESGPSQTEARHGALRDRFERAVMDGLIKDKQAGPEATGLGAVTINSAAALRLWNTSNIGFARLEAEAILMGLSERGLCASAGAACSSGSLEPSPVLLAMGIPDPIAHGSVRFSLSRFTTADEVDRAAALVVEVVTRLAKTMPT